MDDLITEFIAETAEGLGELDTQLIALEQNPSDAEIIGGIFRIVHTIKGTCGFLGLPRLESVAHSAENVLGKFRDCELTPTAASVTLILRTLDLIKDVLAGLEQNGAEPVGDDSELIADLDAMAEGKTLGDDDADDDGGIDLGPACIEDPAVTALEERLAAEEALAEGLVAEAEEPESAPVALAPKAAAEAGPAAAKSGREISVAAQNIRVSVNLLEDLMTMVSELVLTRNQLLQTLRQQEDSSFATPLQRLNHITSELQEGVMKTRMQPIGNAWNKLPRIVRDLAQDLDKKIDLEMIGAETELDRQVLELIKDPLTHMVRNSCDHGLEMPADRRAVGKPDAGKITLHALHEGGHIIIRIADDGKGLPIEKIKAKAIANGIATEAELESLSNQEINQFIFKPGFSTAQKVTNVSGRGVGMDVVRNNIEKIGGAIELESIEGLGSTFTIKIPLTLAIVAALIVECCDERFAIPQISVLELVRASARSEHRIELIDRTPVLRLRDRLLPLAHLGDLLKLSEGKLAAEGDHFVVVCQVGPHTFGIVVDRVFDTEEIVVKPVAPILRDNPVFSGNTVLGDGSVVMILDPNGLAADMGAGHTAESTAQDQSRLVAGSEGEIAALLMFKAGGGAPKAVPLSLVARLEDVPTDKIETADGREILQYRGKIMPLMSLGHVEDGENKPVIVFNDGPRWAGLIVDEIVDIVETNLTFEMQGGMSSVLGTLVVNGASTEIIDTAFYLSQIYPDWFAGADPENIRKNEILIVDDSPFFRHLLSPLLQQAGYAVTSVDSAEHALALKDNGKHFDLIVSDIDMPGMDGFAFAEAVRSSSEWATTPLVALSGNNDNSRVERGREAGFAGYVGKTDRDALLLTLSQTLASTGAS